MKKYGLFLIIMLFAVSLAGCDPCQVNAFTKIGDKIATIGKTGTERTQIRAARKANRAAKCAEQQGGALKKKMGL